MCQQHVSIILMALKHDLATTFSSYKVLCKYWCSTDNIIIINITVNSVIVLKALCHAIRADCLLMKPDAPTR